MKKFIYLTLALLALPFVMTSCSDEDDLPNVDYVIKVSGGYIDPADGIIYAVRGTTLKVESLSVINLDSNEPAVINHVAYYWDFIYLRDVWLAPYPIDIEIDEKMPLGRHKLSAKTEVLAVDKEIGIGVVEYTVKVVESEDDIPETARPPQDAEK